MILLLPRELDNLCDYMASHHRDLRPVRRTYLVGQTYTKKHKQKIKDCLGGIVMVGSLRFLLQNLLCFDWCIFIRVKMCAES